MKAGGTIYCYSCESGNALKENTERCPACKGIVFYRGGRPTRVLLVPLEPDVTPEEITPAAPVRMRRRGVGPDA